MCMCADSARVYSNVRSHSPRFSESMVQLSYNTPQWPRACLPPRCHFSHAAEMEAFSIVAPVHAQCAELRRRRLRAGAKLQ